MARPKFAQKRDGNHSTIVDHLGYYSRAADEKEMKAYYNEFDKNAAAWLRELIKEGLITDGEVDERSIEDVLPADLAGFDRCHFFAGIGVWDYALNLAGMDGQVWTGSCPCQPFSAAGKREGTADERHLWPAFFHLINQCRPNTLFGEQVSSKDGRAWLDIVSSDLEAVGYTIGALDLPACSVGAPHKRQRFFFVANTASDRRFRQGAQGTTEEGRQPRSEYAGELAIRPEGRSSVDGMEKSTALGRRGWGDGDTSGSGGKVQVAGRSGSSDLANAISERGCSREPRSEDAGDARLTSEVVFTNGFWRDAEWTYCRDEKYRPTKPGIFPLVNGATGRVALLRGAGNAISPQVAQAFIESYLETA